MAKSKELELGDAIPAIETQVGYKTTTVRLTNAQFEEVDLFARAMDMSMTEFTRKALDIYVKHVAKRPEVQRSVRRQIAHVTRMLDRVSGSMGISPNGDGDEDDDE